jgi:hypothetical protein
VVTVHEGVEPVLADPVVGVVVDSEAVANDFDVEVCADAASIVVIVDVAIDDGIDAVVADQESDLTECATKAAAVPRKITGASVPKDAISPTITTLLKGTCQGLDTRLFRAAPKSDNVEACDNIDAGKMCTVSLDEDDNKNDDLGQCILKKAITFFCPAKDPLVTTKVVPISVAFKCQVCGLQSFTDTDSQKGVLSGTIRWGANMRGGKHFEKVITGYRLIFVDGCGFQVGAPVGFIDKVPPATKVPTCCDDTQYAIELSAVTIPKDGMKMQIQLVGSASDDSTIVVPAGEVRFTDCVIAGCPSTVSYAVEKHHINLLIAMVISVMVPLSF